MSDYDDYKQRQAERCNEDERDIKTLRDKQYAEERWLIELRVRKDQECIKDTCLESKRVRLQNNEHIYRIMEKETKDHYERLVIYRKFLETEYDIVIDTDNEKVEIAFGEWFRLCDNSQLQNKKIAILSEAIRYYAREDNGDKAKAAIEQTKTGWMGREASISMCSQCAEKRINTCRHVGFCYDE